MAPPSPQPGIYHCFHICWAEVARRIDLIRPEAHNCSKIEIPRCKKYYRPHAERGGSSRCPSGKGERAIARFRRLRYCRLNLDLLRDFPLAGRGYTGPLEQKLPRVPMSIILRRLRRLDHAIREQSVGEGTMHALECDNFPDGFVPHFGLANDDPWIPDTDPD